MKKEYPLSKTASFMTGLFYKNYKLSKKTLLDKQIARAASKHYKPKKGFVLSTYDDVPIFSLFQKNSDSHMFFFHGGAYVLKGQSFHFSLIKKIHKQCSCSVHYIDYPMPPECTVTETINTVLKAIESFSKEQAITSFYLAGDSAGAGLALVLSKHMENTYNIPHVFLLSPWLDLTMNEPYQTDDPILSVEGLKKAAGMYAPHAEHTPGASPIFLSELPQIPLTVFTSTGDMLHNDALKLYEKQPHNTDLHIVHDALHDFALFPFTNEQKMVIEIIKKTV